MMRTLLTLTLLSLTMMAAPRAHAGRKKMQIESMPDSVESFVAMRNKLAVTPEGGAVMFAVALIKFSEGDPLGIPFLTLAIDQSRLSDGGFGVEGRQPTDLRDFRDRNGAKPWIASSMIQGTSPAKKYALPALPWTVNVVRSDAAGDDDAKVFIQTSGADSPKPLRLLRNDKGIWKAAEWSSFQGNCRPPEEKKVDNL